MNRKKSAIFAIAVGIWAAPAQAEDCGFPPTEEPVIPNGAVATREEMRIAVQAVQLYSKIVNQYLNCLDTRRDETFLNLTPDQQTRWTEDYNAVVDHLAKIETGINQQIRTFNQRS